MKIEPKKVEQLYWQTLTQMLDGGLDADSFEAFRDFTADYPSSAWLADYRRYGGVAADNEAYAVEEALMDLARERLA